jgi:hypothetical protein
VSAKSLEQVFLNVEEIESVHKELQVSLKSCHDDFAGSVEVFKSFATRLKVYSVYIAGFEAAAQELHRWETEGTVLHLLFNF